MSEIAKLQKDIKRLKRIVRSAVPDRHARKDLARKERELAAMLRTAGKSTSSFPTPRFWSARGRCTRTSRRSPRKVAAAAPNAGVAKSVVVVVPNAENAVVAAPNAKNVVAVVAHVVVVK